MRSLFQLVVKPRKHYKRHSRMARNPTVSVSTKGGTIPAAGSFRRERDHAGQGGTRYTSSRSGAVLLEVGLVAGHSAGRRGQAVRRLRRT